MEENEELAALMKGLRGQNLKDSLFADNTIKLRLVEVSLINLATGSIFLRLLKSPL